VSRNTKTVLALLAAVLVLAVVPFFLAPGAEFGGSDDAGSRMVEEIQGEAYEPWFTPVLETLLGGELPGEIESLLFCIQTGVGVGVLAPLTSLGSMCSDALGGISTYPYRLIIPAIIISIMILSFNLFGDGLRDALDPRLKK